jgi:hypothetical protein
MKLTMLLCAALAALNLHAAINTNLPSLPPLPTSVKPFHLHVGQTVSTAQFTSQPFVDQAPCPTNTIVVDVLTNGDGTTRSCIYYSFSNCVWYTVVDPGGLPTNNTNTIVVYCCGTQLPGYPVPCQLMLIGPPFGPPATNCLDYPTNLTVPVPVCFLWVATNPPVTVITNTQVPTPPIPISIYIIAGKRFIEQIMWLVLMGPPEMVEVPQSKPDLKKPSPHGDSGSDWTNCNVLVTVGTNYVWTNRVYLNKYGYQFFYWPMTNPPQFLRFQQQ